VLPCESVELPGAAVLALSELYSLSKASCRSTWCSSAGRRPRRHAASALRVLGPVHEMGFPVCVAAWAAVSPLST